MKKLTIIGDIYFHLLNNKNRVNIEYVRIKSNKKGNYLANQIYVLDGKICLRFDFLKHGKTYSKSFGFVSSKEDILNLKRKTLKNLLRKLKKSLKNGSY